MHVLVTTHAYLRAKQRFPSTLGYKDYVGVANVLTAIAHRGEPVGDSCVQNCEYRLGHVGPDVVIVVLKKTDVLNGVQRAVVVTCLTEEELKHSGANREHVQCS